VPFQNFRNRRPHNQSRLLLHRCQASRFVSKKSAVTVCGHGRSSFPVKKRTRHRSRCQVTGTYLQIAPRSKISRSVTVVLQDVHLIPFLNVQHRDSASFPSRKIGQGCPEKSVFAFSALVVDLFMTEGKNVVRFFFNATFRCVRCKEGW